MAFTELNGTPPKDSKVTINLVDRSGLVATIAGSVAKRGVLALRIRRRQRPS